jgi:ubiquinone biosynthesis protein
MESIVIGSKYHLYYPLELVLMVKAIITYEGVGNVIMPGFDIQKVSKKHIRRMLLGEVNPIELIKTQIQTAPEIMDIITRSPLVLSEAFKKYENSLVEKKSPKDKGLKLIIFGGCCVIAGSILAAAGLEWFVYAPMMLFGGILALKS